MFSNSHFEMHHRVCEYVTGTSTAGSNVCNWAFRSHKQRNKTNRDKTETSVKRQAVIKFSSSPTTVHIRHLIKKYFHTLVAKSECSSVFVHLNVFQNAAVLPHISVQ